MVSLNRAWWEHLAPKPMHWRFRELETLLRNWCRTDYGSMWRDAASSRGGAIRVRPGQAIPTFHVILIKDRPAFVAPQARVREGHRVVQTLTDQWRSGRPLEEGELALWPEIRVEMVDDPALIAAAKPNPALHVFGVRDPALLFTVPANLLLAPTSLVKKSFVLYQHIFGDGPSWPNDGFFYVGVTTRSWQKRWVEHRRAMESGSPLLFHRKLREEISAGRVTYVNHKVMGITEDLEQLYATEEMLVAGHWNDDRRLNMIPAANRASSIFARTACSRIGPSPRRMIATVWSRRGYENTRERVYPPLGFRRNGKTRLGRSPRSADATAGCPSSRCVQSASWRRTTLQMSLLSE